MRLELPIREYRYHELFGIILRATKGDFLYGHAAIRYLLETGQLERIIRPYGVRYIPTKDVLDLPVFRLQKARHYIALVRKRTPETFCESRVFVYTFRPLDYGRTFSERSDNFSEELDSLEEYFWSLPTAISLGKARGVDLAFEEDLVDEDEVAGYTFDDLYAVVYIAGYEYLLEKVAGEWKQLKREEVE